MITFLLFILILSVLVLIHEFGHFYVAKKNGVRVEEFGFGIPPRLFGKKVGETLYSFNLLPFGGFVKLSGEDETGIESLEAAEKDDRNFVSKSPLQRISIILAGVTMNALLAMFLYYVFFAFTGFKSFTIPNFFDYDFKLGEVQELNTVVLGFGENSAAEVADMKVGEAILEIDGVQVYNVDDVRSNVKDKVDQETSILLMDVRSTDRDIRTVRVYPKATENGEGVIGVYIGESATIDYNRTKLLAGPMHAYNMFSYSSYTFSHLIKTSFNNKTIEPISSSVAGPVGIISIVGGIVQQGSELQTTSEQVKTIFLSLIDLTALLSLSLAFINVLPFPALDGGRLIFIVIELVTKKKISPKYEVAFHQIGMILLLGLLVLITIRDVTRMF